MPRPPTLKTIEVFSSIQGEGLRQGEASIFIRLAGCSLRCPFCDTKTSWTGGRERTVERLSAQAARLRKSRPADWLVLTGGEPLQQDVGPLLRALKTDGWKIQVETNGRYFRRLPVDWYTISPKPPEYEFRPQYRTLAREVKLVVSRELTYGVLSRLRTFFPASVPILLQLESNGEESLGKALRLLHWAMKESRPNVRLAVQLHKFLRLP
jgi:7-carboxy-7-deazaguanine synthase